MIQSFLSDLMSTDFSLAIGSVGLSKFCMAKRLKNNSSSSSSILEISIKSQRIFLVFMGFFFIFIAIVNSATDPSTSTHATIFADSSSTAKTNDFRPERRGKADDHRKSKRSEFEAGDHEVPSGPNPISNR